MRSPIRVLVIEDNQSDLLAIQRALEQHGKGWGFDAAPTLADGIRLANEQRFDAVVLDLRLPDSTGLDSLRRFESGTERLPLVAFGDAQSCEDAARVDYGVHDYLEKENLNPQSLSRSIHNAIQRREMHSRIKDLAYTDVVTGVSNRTRFEQTLDAEFDTAKIEGRSSLVVLFIGIDDFKYVNELYGHEVGDALLSEFADRLKKIVESGDLIARFGGDEFVVLLTAAQEDQIVDGFIERFQMELSRPFCVDRLNQKISASIGIARISTSHVTAGDLLRDADAAMYRAKEEGQSKSHWSTPVLRESMDCGEGVETQLRLAVERNEFELFYQPIVDMRSRQLSRFEALLRWRHPKDGIVSPTKIISFAESTGLIIPIGRWVLLEACRQLAVWRTEFDCDDLGVCLNVSPVQVLSRTFVQDVIDAISLSRLPPGLVNLEFTEPTIMENPVKVHAVLRILREAGVKISIDDFGTGYSSLSLLYKFQYDSLKIDREFVGTMDEEGDAFIKAILMLSESLGLEVIAEGVENKEQANQLLGLGCHFGQGFHFDRPRPAEVARKHIIGRCVRSIC